MIIKRWGKRLLQRGVAAGAPWLWRHGRPSLVVLMYHRVLPADDPRLLDEQPGMVVHPGTLRMHLQSLRRHFDMVSLGDWLDRVQSGRPVPRRACAITFDDGWRDNHEYALPLLKEQACPATIFLASSMIGTDARFWPERLGRALRLGAGEPASLWRTPEFAWLDTLGLPAEVLTGLPDPERLDRIVCAAKRYPEQTLYRHVEAMEARLAPDRHDTGGPALLDWVQVQEMTASGVFQVGSHGRTHTRLLPGLPETRLREEVAGSRAEIEHRTGITPTLFSFPNGDCSPPARHAVASHYRGACLTRTGWNGPGHDPWSLKRISMHQDVSHDRTALLARVSGWV